MTSADLSLTIFFVALIICITVYKIFKMYFKSKKQQAGHSGGKRDYMKCLDMKNFVKERDEALLSLDKDKIMAYAKKYQVSLPKNEKVFWAGIHKARLGVKSFSEEAKQISAEWLVNNGFKPFLYPKESEGVSE